jgi:hypothetical protein
MTSDCLPHQVRVPMSYRGQGSVRLPVARLRCLSHDDAEAERRLERRLQAEACEKGAREAAEAKEKRTLNRLLCEGMCFERRFEHGWASACAQCPLSASDDLF